MTMNHSQITTAQRKNSRERHAAPPTGVPRQPKLRGLAAARANAQDHLGPLGGPSPAFTGMTPRKKVIR
jgi:hypothetical protein